MNQQLFFLFVHNDEMNEAMKSDVHDFLKRQADFEFEEGPFLWLLGLIDKRLVFATQIHIGADVVSLYSVCTHAEFRRRGIMRAGFKAILEQYKGRKLWVACEETEPELVAVYEKLGFTSPRETNVVPYFGELRRNVIELTREN